MLEALPFREVWAVDFEFAVAPLQDVIAVALEDGPEHFAEVELVVGEDDARAGHRVQRYHTQTLAPSADVIAVA